MKKIIVFLLILCTFLLFSCKDSMNDEKQISNEDSNEDASLAFRSTNILEMIDISTNVFSGRLQSLGWYDYKLGESDFLEVGARYFFMLGINEKSTNFDKAEELLDHSQLKITKLLDFGKMENTYGKEKNITYPELLNDIFSWHRYPRITLAADFDLPEESALSEMYRMADNVFFGEVLEAQEENKVKQSGFGFIYSVKIKVINVYKGEYKSGDIVEELCTYSAGHMNLIGGTEVIESNIFFTGEEIEQRLENALEKNVSESS